VLCCWYRVSSEEEPQKCEASELRDWEGTLVLRQLLEDRRGDRAGEVGVTGERAGHLLYEPRPELGRRDLPAQLLEVRLGLEHPRVVLGEVQRDGRAGGADGDGARHGAAGTKLGGLRRAPVVVLALVRRLQHRAVLRAPLHLLTQEQNRCQRLGQIHGSRTHDGSIPVKIN
jgi:hypothetical protein